MLTFRVTGNSFSYRSGSGGQKTRCSRGGGGGVFVFVTVVG
jgi:hypothetical protein